MKETLNLDLLARLIPQLVALAKKTLGFVQLAGRRAGGSLCRRWIHLHPLCQWPLVALRPCPERMVLGFRVAPAP